MPQTEPSHADRTTRPLRRRLLVHAAAFAIAGGVTLSLGSPATTASPTVQEGRFLEGDSVDVDYSCVGADQTTNDLLATFGLSPFSMPVTLTSASVEPSPSPGETFGVGFTWDFTIDPSIEAFAVGLGVTSFTISNTATDVDATDGATGSATGIGDSNVVVLGDGSVPIGYTDGPFVGSFTRTAAVDEPIVFTPGAITSTVVTSGNVTLLIACTPGAGTLTMADQDGVAPSTTTTTRPAVVTTTTQPDAVLSAGGQNTAGPGQIRQLPRTGSSDKLMLALVAVGLIDVGYLTLSASQPGHRRRATSAL